MAEARCSLGTHYCGFVTLRPGRHQAVTGTGQPEGPQTEESFPMDQSVILGLALLVALVANVAIFAAIARRRRDLRQLARSGGADSGASAIAILGGDAGAAGCDTSAAGCDGGSG